MNWRDRLAAGERLVLDGGTGSELRRRGVTLSGTCWSASANLAHGELLTAIHRDYIAAGADIVTANTFGTTRFVLAAAGLGEQFEAINRAAIEAAQRAAASADRKGAIAASLSCMPPAFDTRAYPSPDAEYRDYAELAEWFAANGVDLALLEMLQDAPHAERACRAVQAAGLPFVAGISCRLDARRGPDQARLVAFDDANLGFDSVLEAILPFAPVAIAVMHSPLNAMLPALTRLREIWAGPLGAYAEIPYPEDPEVSATARLSPEAYANAACGWVAAGATLIGGCCGTTPAHIAVLASL